VAVSFDDGAPPLVLDLGTGARRLGLALVERLLPCPLVLLPVAAFVSRLHLDHVQGLPFFSPALREDVELTIYGPGGEAGLRRTFEALASPTYFPVPMDALPAQLRFRSLGDGAGVEVGGVTVRARSLVHRGPSLGCRLEAGGLSIAYVSDHQAPVAESRVRFTVTEAARDLCAGVDLLIHDGQYTEEECAAKPDWGHSTVSYATYLAGEVGAKALALFHHDPAHDDATLDRLGEEAERRADGRFTVVMAREDLALDVATSCSNLPTADARIAADLRATGHLRPS
jgi:ribonuclease BN (tRNA processing enzyme)